MQFGIQAHAGELAKTVKRLVRVAGPLTPIKLTARGGAAALEMITVSDDRSIGLAASVGGNVLAPGSVSVGARELLRVLRMFASATVALEAGWGNQLLVRASGATVRLDATEGSSLRLMGARERPVGFTVPCDSLRRALWPLPLAMAKRTNGLNGAMMEVAPLGDAHRLRVCASDGRQMALFDIRLAGASPYPEGRRRIHISRTGVGALVAQLGAAAGSATIEMVNDTAAVTSADANGASSTIRWMCPDRDGFVHDPQVALDRQVHSLVLDVDGGALRRCIRSVAARQDKGMRLVTLTTNAMAGKLVVAGVADDRVNATIGARVVDGDTGRDRCMKLHISYLRSATKSLGGGMVRLVFPARHCATALMMLGRGGGLRQRWLVMPIV